MWLDKILEKSVPAVIQVQKQAAVWLGRKTAAYSAKRKTSWLFTFCIVSSGISICVMFQPMLSRTFHATQILPKPHQMPKHIGKPGFDPRYRDTLSNIQNNKYQNALK